MKLNAMNKRISRSQMLNIVLLIVLLILVAFGYLYYKKTSIVSVVSNTLPTLSNVPKQPDYLFTIYGQENNFLDHPRSTFVWNNKIYVADTWHGRIVVFDYNGKYVDNIGGRGNFAGAMKSPSEVAVYNNHLYVADYDLGKVGIYTLDGVFAGYFAEKVLKMPSNIKVFGDKFYIFDSAPQKLYVLDSSGKVLQSFGGKGTEPGRFYFANGVNVDEDGNIYVADSNNFRIQIFTPDGKVKSVWKSDKKDNADGYTIPRGIAFDRKGYIWTAHNLAGGVSVTDPAGKRLALFIQGESQEDMLTLPTSVFIDENNRLYVAEFGGNRILVYQIQ